MGWTQKIAQHIAEMLASNGVKFQIDRMLYQLDSENKMKSKIERLDDTDTVRLILCDTENNTFASHDFSIREIMKTKSKWETFNLIKQEYLRLKTFLENNQSTRI